MSNPTPHRLLIIDDTPSIHDDIRKILQARSPENQRLERLETELFDSVPDYPTGFSVELVSALQGSEGLARLEESLAARHPFALALVDMRMPPGWDGIETIRRLWKVDPRLQVILCTAYSDHCWEELTANLSHPENLLILKKPFDNIELLQLVHALTRRWELANRQPSSQVSHLSTGSDGPSFHSAILAEAFKCLPWPLIVRTKDGSDVVYSNDQYLSSDASRRSRSQSPGIERALTTTDVPNPQSACHVEFNSEGVGYVLTAYPPHALPAARSI